ncbi:5-methylcytosine restriction system specificity protein McrC [Bacillus canaveralius]|uniref:5-methylcytosine restriction system specificity protein McrC n=1 Tax=Bacillus canaveralius TaxID=1403243 RepID=UPI000F779832|nr:restriction endonuclease [Bacillus canaveralius]RSK53268.1 restriction endonuclease [Bacillus canaveralius]
MNSLAESSKIPIKNLYYMLCYAWGHLSETDNKDVLNNDDKDLSNLLTRILVGKLGSLIKRGFYREYKNFKEESSTLRGKIQFKESISSFSFKRGKIHFECEEMNHNILHNQLIKSTLEQLARNESLDAELRKQVLKLLPYFIEVNCIKLTSELFNGIKLHRSNQHYRFVLDVCRFLVESTLLHEEGNSGNFTDFYRDPRAMAMLFESFVRSFYKYETPSYRVYRENIYWNAEGDNLNYLPLMQTDISLENSEKKIIMDTKYYQQSLSFNHDSQKLISGNLYQLFAYLNNHQKAVGKPTTGILLYPEVNHILDLSYMIQGHPVKICTVDLGTDWRSIHERLIAVVEG